LCLHIEFIKGKRFNEWPSKTEQKREKVAA